MKTAQSTRLGCPEFRRVLAMERRSFLKAGVLGVAGLTLGDLLRFEAQASGQDKSPVRDHSVIILWMRGGPSQHETWDPKPDAPVEYRGEFGAVTTSVPGIQICDLLPMSAKIMHKWSIIRCPRAYRCSDSRAGAPCSRAWTIFAAKWTRAVR